MDIITLTLTIHEGSSMLLTATGLLTHPALGGLSEKGLDLSRSPNGELLSRSPNGEFLSLTGVPHNGVELPLLAPIDSKDPLVLYECCLFKVPLFDESSVELLDFRRL